MCKINGKPPSSAGMLVFHLWWILNLIWANLFTPKAGGS